MWEVVVLITASALRLPKWHSTCSFFLPLFTTSCNAGEGVPQSGRCCLLSLSGLTQPFAVVLLPNLLATAAAVAA